MDVRTIEGVRIEGLAACLPANAVPNDEKSAKATGIVTRRVAAAGTTVADLCVRAAEKALADTGARPADFGAVLCVSFTQRNRMPATAIEAQARLGFQKDVLAFDVTLACSGWAYGLYLAGLLVRETGKKVLLLDGDVQSAFMKTDDAATQPLLGDAGTATIVGMGNEAWQFSFIADGEKGDALKLENGGTIEMDGFGVFRFVATDVVAYLKEFVSLQSSVFSLQSSVNKRQPFTFVPHQPNVYMVRQLAKSVGIPEDRTMISCDRLGNLSSASVPATIAWRGVRGKVLLAAFGGGLSVSLGTITIADGCPLSVEEV